MKKRYMQPTMEVVEIETRQPMLTASGFSVNIYYEDEYAVENNLQLSRRHGYDWDDDEDEEEEY